MKNNNGTTINGTTFKAKGRIWEFECGGYSLRRDLPGGRTTAEKIASIIGGAVKRSKDGLLDNLGRANIHQVIERAKAKLNAAGLVNHRQFPDHRFQFVGRA